MQHDILVKQLDKRQSGSTGNVQDVLYYDLGTCPEDIISVRDSGFVEVAVWEEKTLSLPDPAFIGQQLLVYINQGEGSLLIKSNSSLDLCGSHIIIMSGKGAFVQLVSIRMVMELCWRVVTSNGATLG